MTHPFDKIIVPAAEAGNVGEARPTRRSFFARVAAGAAGATAALFGRSVSAQVYGGPGPGRVTTFAYGEEGGGVHGPPRWPGPVSTRALGEEGGGATTFALGEEGGGVPRRPPRYRAPVTTHALGEEGGATTFALGEEGGGYPPIRHRPGRVTTFALGEEG